jgi:hypothetical protein
MNVLKAVARAMGCFVLGVDHFGKDLQAGTRGAYSKESSGGLVLACLGNKQLSGRVTDTRLAVRKHRGGRQGQEYPFVLREVAAPEPDQDGAADPARIGGRQPGLASTVRVDHLGSPYRVEVSTPSVDASVSSTAPAMTQITPEPPRWPAASNRDRSQMGKRSTFERREGDFYPTPRSAVLPLIPRLRGVRTFTTPWCATWKASGCAAPMRATLRPARTPSGPALAQKARRL